MKSIEWWVNGIAISIGGILGWIFHGMDGFLSTLIVFVTIDYLTGFICAIVNQKLSSEIGFRGIWKKVLIFILVWIGSIIDSQLLQQGEAMRNAIIFFYLANEGISILENVSAVGLPVPKKLKDLLIQLRHQDNNANQK